MEDDRKQISPLDLTPIDKELDANLSQADANTEEEHEQDFIFSCNTNTRRDERQLALYLLYAIDRMEYSVDLEYIKESFQEGFECKIPTTSYAFTLVRGTVDEREHLDDLLKPFLKNWQLDRLGCCTKLVLHMALWELKQPHAISSIIINEAVELAKMFAEKDAYRFVNGILDEITKQLDVNAEHPTDFSESPNNPLHI